MNKYKYTGNLDDFISTKNDFIVSKGFNRIVHGERGAYVELTNDQILVSQLYVKSENYWRFESSVVYYIAWHTLDDVMVYQQLREVDYADYIIGNWYISPVFLANFEVDENDY